MKKTLALGLGLLAGSPAFALMEPATPESQGVSSEAILKFIDGCEKTFGADEHGAVHGFVIVRHGKVIAEGSWKPFDTLNETHMLYSHSKSFVSSAVGFLADDGKIDLDERVVDFFPDDLPATVSENLRALRVRDLLTMNVGKRDHVLRDDGDWAKRFLAMDFFRAPGTGFKYDSDATYMLAAIVEKKSGMKLMDYLKVKMFDKIGITKAWSTVSPQGIACGGWGMNMTTRELARFGQLYLDRGMWGETYVLSPFWTDLATARHTWSGWQDIGMKGRGEGTDWEQGYGFQFWRCTHGAYRADGAGGQYTIVMPDEDMVVSAHAGIDDFQKHLNLVWDNLLPAAKDGPLPENPEALRRLRERLANLEIAPVAGGPAAGEAFWLGDYPLKENAHGFTSVSLAAAPEGRTLVKFGTRCGEQQFLAGTKAWCRGSRIRIDPETFEGMNHYIGEQPVAASCGLCADGTFRLKAYFTGTPGHMEFAVSPDRKLTGAYSAVGGCKLESK